MPDIPPLIITGFSFFHKYRLRASWKRVSCGDILLLKFQDVYDIIKQYEPDVLLLPEQKAQVYRAGGIRVRENTAERTELLFWT